MNHCRKRAYKIKYGRDGKGSLIIDPSPHPPPPPHILHSFSLTHSFYLSALVHCFSLSYFKGSANPLPTPHILQSFSLIHSLYLSALVHCFSLSSCKGSANSLPHPPHDPISLPHSFVLFISSRALLLTFLL